MVETKRRARVAILGNGSGTIAESVIQHSQQDSSAFEVCLVLSTKSDSGILEKAQLNNVPTLHLAYNTSVEFEDAITQALKHSQVTLLLLAGFTRLLPVGVVKALNGRVVNTHPSLLPRYGGKGMYGRHVHQAVLAAKETHTGVTIHWVSEQYDEGGIVFQQTVSVAPTDTVESLEMKVKGAEIEVVPKVINSLCRDLLDTEISTITS